MNYFKDFWATHKTQLFRFVRVTVMTFLATGVLTSGSYNKDAVIAAVVAALEVGWRVLFPADPVTLQSSVSNKKV